jgi:hypothetical protein
MTKVLDLTPLKVIEITEVLVVENVIHYFRTEGSNQGRGRLNALSALSPPLQQLPRNLSLLTTQWLSRKSHSYAESNQYLTKCLPAFGHARGRWERNTEMGGVYSSPHDAAVYRS